MRLRGNVHINHGAWSTAQAVKEAKSQRGHEPCYPAKP
jgi:hypothetical protein